MFGIDHYRTQSSEESLRVDREKLQQVRTRYPSNKKRRSPGLGSGPPQFSNPIARKIPSELSVPIKRASPRASPRR